MGSEFSEFGKIREAGREMHERPPFTTPDEHAVPPSEAKRKTLEVDIVDPQDDTRFKSLCIHADEISLIYPHSEDAPVGSKVGELQTAISMNYGIRHKTPHTMHQIAQHLPVTDLDNAQATTDEGSHMKFLQMRVYVPRDSFEVCIINADQITEVIPHRVDDGPAGSKLFDIQSRLLMKGGGHFSVPYPSEQITPHLQQAVPAAVDAEPIVVRDSQRRSRVDSSAFPANTRA